MRARGSASKKINSARIAFCCTLAVATIVRIAAAGAEPLVLDVTRAEVGYDLRTREPIVSFRLSEDSKRRFAELTTQNVGRRIEIRVDGRTYLRPVVREPIFGGVGQISGLASPAETDDVAARLSSGTARLEIEVVAD